MTDLEAMDTIVMRAPDSHMLDDVDAQALWLATQKQMWRSLAMVPGDAGLSCLEAANALARIAWWYTGRPTCVADLRNVSLRMVAHQLAQIGEQLGDGELVIIALRSMHESPACALIAAAADAAVLCVRLGSTRIADAEKTVERVGREKFIGTIVLKPWRPV
jgi:hypothetical protein